MYSSLKPVSILIVSVCMLFLLTTHAAAIQYTYDAVGNRTTMVDSTGTTRYEYDALNRLTKIANPQGKVTTFTYDAAGRRSSETYPNGLSVYYTYDAAGRILFISQQMGNNPLNSIRYTYDNVDNRTSMTNQYGVHNYAYDQLSRLIQATHPQPPNPLQQIERFMYDAVGNRIDAANVYNAGNQLLEDANFIYSYDKNGNTKSKVDKTTGKYTRYYWNAENKLVKVQEYTNIASTTPVAVNKYIYDGYGRRVAKNVNGTISKYVYDNEDILLETDDNEAILARYTHGPGVDEPLIMDRSGQSYYYVVDGLGSIVKIIGASGNVVNDYVYDVFGNMVEKTAGVPNMFTYTGREYDTELGLYYYRNRYYDAKIGRFLNEDFLDMPSILLSKQYQKKFPLSNLLYEYELQHPVMFNYYTYVGNNPVRYIDPWGLWYINIGSSLGSLSPGMTRGVFIGPDGTYTYVGWGWMTSPGFNITFSTSNPAAGCSKGLQMGYFGGFSINRDTNGDWSGEIGWVTPGLSFTEVKLQRDQPKEDNKEIILP